jgi:hypothetical protein
MAVAADVQLAITQRYSQLTNAVTHDPTQERAVVAPQFRDRAKMTLRSFEYDPLTVVVQKIVRTGDRIEVHAQYVGVHGHNANTVDQWIGIDGQWYLVERR